MQAPSQTVNISHLTNVLMLPVFFLLHSYNELFGFIPPGYLLTFGLYMYLFAGIVFLIAFLITRSTLPASFITFCTLVFTLFFGAWHDLIKSITPDTIFSRYWVVLPVTLAGILELPGIRLKSAGGWAPSPLI